MLVIDPVILSLLLPAAVLARPNVHERLHHKRLPSALYSDIQPSAVHYTAPTAPFPTANKTQGAATASGTGTGIAGPVTIQSTVNIIPLPPSAAPITTAGGALPAPGGSNDLGASGGAGQAGSPIETGAPGAGSGSSGSNGDICGPPTVTITKPNTITVTVPGPAGQAKSSPPTSSNGLVEGADAKKGNSGSQVDGAPSQVVATTPTAAVEQKKAEGQDSAAQQKPATEQKPATTTQQAETPQETKPEAEETHAKEPSAVPEQHQQPESKPKEEESPKNTYQPPPETQQAPAPTSSASPSEESEEPEPEGSNNVVQARGIVYASLDEANAMGGIGWGCNWDSSPLPAVGKAKGSLNYEFVPQLWGPDELHTSLWPGNSAGYPYVMAFNEPNIGKEGGGCGPMTPSDAIAPYESNMKPNKAAGQKIISPCVSNNAPEWLDAFLASTSLKPDAVCFHWYGETLEGLKAVVPQFKELQEKYSIPELWMTEWAFNVAIEESEMKDVMDYLEGESGVDRYAYNALKMVGMPGIKAAYMA